MRYSMHRPRHVAKPITRHNISLMRHRGAAGVDPTPGISINPLAYDYPRDFRVPEHADGSHQLIYATGGVMEVSAGQSSGLIPPQFAVWVPARTTHRIRMAGSVSMRTLFLRRASAASRLATWILLPSASPPQRKRIITSLLVTLH